MQFELLNEQMKEKYREDILTMMELKIFEKAAG